MSIKCRMMGWSFPRNSPLKDRSKIRRHQYQKYLRSDSEGSGVGNVSRGTSDGDSDGSLCEIGKASLGDSGSKDSVGLGEHLRINNKSLINSPSTLLTFVLLETFENQRFLSIHQVPGREHLSGLRLALISINLFVSQRFFRLKALL